MVRGGPKLGLGIRLSERFLDRHGLRDERHDPKDTLTGRDAGAREMPERLSAGLPNLDEAARAARICRQERVGVSRETAEKFVQRGGKPALPFSLFGDTTILKGFLRFSQSGDRPGVTVPEQDIDPDQAARIFVGAHDYVTAEGWLVRVEDNDGRGIYLAGVDGGSGRFVTASDKGRMRKAAQELAEEMIPVTSLHYQERRLATGRIFGEALINIAERFGGGDITHSELRNILGRACGREHIGADRKRWVDRHIDQFAGLVAEHLGLLRLTEILQRRATKGGGGPRQEMPNLDRVVLRVQRSRLMIAETRDDIAELRRNILRDDAEQAALRQAIEDIEAGLEETSAALQQLGSYDTEFRKNLKAADERKAALELADRIDELRYLSRAYLVRETTAERKDPREDLFYRRLTPRIDAWIEANAQIEGGSLRKGARFYLRFWLADQSGSGSQFISYDAYALRDAAAVVSLDVKDAEAQKLVRPQLRDMITSLVMADGHERRLLEARKRPGTYERPPEVQAAHIITNRMQMRRAIGEPLNDQLMDYFSVIRRGEKIAQEGLRPEAVAVRFFELFYNYVRFGALRYGTEFNARHLAKNGIEPDVMSDLFTYIRDANNRYDDTVVELFRAFFLEHVVDGNEQLVPSAEDLRPSITRTERLRTQTGVTDRAYVEYKKDWGMGEYIKAFLKQLALTTAERKALEIDFASETGITLGAVLRWGMSRGNPTTGSASRSLSPDEWMLMVNLAADEGPRAIVDLLDAVKPQKVTAENWRREIEAAPDKRIFGLDPEKVLPVEVRDYVWLKYVERMRREGRLEEVSTEPEQSLRLVLPVYHYLQDLAEVYGTNLDFAHYLAALSPVFRRALPHAVRMADGRMVVEIRVPDFMRGVSYDNLGLCVFAARGRRDSTIPIEAGSLTGIWAGDKVQLPEFNNLRRIVGGLARSTEHQERLWLYAAFLLRYMFLVDAGLDGFEGVLGSLVTHRSPGAVSRYELRFVSEEAARGRADRTKAAEGAKVHMITDALRERYRNLIRYIGRYIRSVGLVLGETGLLDTTATTQSVSDLAARQEKMALDNTAMEQVFADMGASASGRTQDETLDQWLKFYDDVGRFSRGVVFETRVVGCVDIAGGRKLPFISVPRLADHSISYISGGYAAVIVDDIAGVDGLGRDEIVDIVRLRTILSRELTLGHLTRETIADPDLPATRIAMIGAAAPDWVGERASLEAAVDRHLVLERRALQKGADPRMGELRGLLRARGQRVAERLYGQLHLPGLRDVPDWPEQFRTIARGDGLDNGAIERGITALESYFRAMLYPHLRPYSPAILEREVREQALTDEEAGNLVHLSEQLFRRIGILTGVAQTADMGTGNFDSAVDSVYTNYVRLFPQRGTNDKETALPIDRIAIPVNRELVEQVIDVWLADDLDMLERRSSIADVVVERLNSYNRTTRKHGEAIEEGTVGLTGLLQGRLSSYVNTWSATHDGAAVNAEPIKLAYLGLQTRLQRGDEITEGDIEEAFKDAGPPDAESPTDNEVACLTDFIRHQRNAIRTLRKLTADETFGVANYLNQNFIMPHPLDAGVVYLFLAYATGRLFGTNAVDLSGLSTDHRVIGDRFVPYDDVVAELASIYRRLMVHWMRGTEAALREQIGADRRAVAEVVDVMLREIATANEENTVPLNYGREELITRVVEVSGRDLQCQQLSEERQSVLRELLGLKPIPADLGIERAIKDGVERLQEAQAARGEQIQKAKQEDEAMFAEAATGLEDAAEKAQHLWQETRKQATSAERLKTRNPHDSAGLKDLRDRLIKVREALAGIRDRLGNLFAEFIEAVPAYAETMALRPDLGEAGLRRIMGIEADVSIADGALQLMDTWHNGLEAVLGGWADGLSPVITELQQSVEHYRMMEAERAGVRAAIDRAKELIELIPAEAARLREIYWRFDYLRTRFKMMEEAYLTFLARAHELKDRPEITAGEFHTIVTLAMKYQELWDFLEVDFRELESGAAADETVAAIEREMQDLPISWLHENLRPVLRPLQELNAAAAQVISEFRKDIADIDVTIAATFLEQLEDQLLLTQPVVGVPPGKEYLTEDNMVVSGARLVRFDPRDDVQKKLSQRLKKTQDDLLGAQVIILPGGSYLIGEFEANRFRRWKTDGRCEDLQLEDVSGHDLPSIPGSTYGYRLIEPDDLPKGRPFRQINDALEILINPEKVGGGKGSIRDTILRLASHDDRAGRMLFARFLATVPEREDFYDSERPEDMYELFERFALTYNVEIVKLLGHTGSTLFGEVEDSPASREYVRWWDNFNFHTLATPDRYSRNRHDLMERFHAQMLRDPRLGLLVTRKGENIELSLVFDRDVGEAIAEGSTVAHDTDGVKIDLDTVDDWHLSHGPLHSPHHLAEARLRHIVFADPRLIGHGWQLYRRTLPLKKTDPFIAFAESILTPLLYKPYKTQVEEMGSERHLRLLWAIYNTPMSSHGMLEKVGRERVTDYIVGLADDPSPGHAALVRQAVDLSLAPEPGTDMGVLGMIYLLDRYGAYVDKRAQEGDPVAVSKDVQDQIRNAAAAARRYLEGFKGFNRHILSSITDEGARKRALTNYLAAGVRFVDENRLMVGFSMIDDRFLRETTGGRNVVMHPPSYMPDPALAGRFPETAMVDGWIVYGMVADSLERGEPLEDATNPTVQAMAYFPEYSGAIAIMQEFCLFSSSSPDPDVEQTIVDGLQQLVQEYQEIAKRVYDANKIENLRQRFVELYEEVRPAVIDTLQTDYGDGESAWVHLTGFNEPWDGFPGMSWEGIPPLQKLRLLMPEIRRLTPEKTGEAIDIAGGLSDAVYTEEENKRFRDTIVVPLFGLAKEYDGFSPEISLVTLAAMTAEYFIKVHDTPEARDILRLLTEFFKRPGQRTEEEFVDLLLEQGLLPDVRTILLDASTFPDLPELVRSCGWRALTGVDRPWLRIDPRSDREGEDETVTAGTDRDRTFTGSLQAERPVRPVTRDEMRREFERLVPVPWATLSVANQELATASAFTMLMKEDVDIDRPLLTGIIDAIWDRPQTEADHIAGESTRRIFQIMRSDSWQGLTPLEQRLALIHLGAIQRQRPGVAMDESFLLKIIERSSEKLGRGVAHDLGRSGSPQPPRRRTKKAPAPRPAAGQGSEIEQPVDQSLGSERMFSETIPAEWRILSPVQRQMAITILEKILREDPGPVNKSGLMSVIQETLDRTGGAKGESGLQIIGFFERSSSKNRWRKLTQQQRNRAVVLVAQLMGDGQKVNGRFLKIIIDTITRSH